MKVWIIEISDFLPGVDEENRLYRAGMLAEALVKAGHQVLWWTSTFNHQKRRQRFDGSTTIDFKKGYRFRLLHGPSYRNSISLERWIHNRTVAKEFAREIEKIEANERPDIIYACLPTLEVSEQAVFYGFRYHIPVVVDIRELWPDNYLTVFPPLFRPLLRIMLKNEFLRAYRILHYSTTITASSSAYLNWGVKTGKRQSCVNDKWFPLGSVANDVTKRLLEQTKSICLPNGVMLPSDCLLITFIGTFTSHFDYDTLLKVIRDLYRSGKKHVHFLFVGDGDKAVFFRKHSKGLSNIHLLGWCEKAVIDSILSVSSIGLAPYMMELKPTLPNKPFEYMAAGLPILSSLGGELESIIRRESIGLQYQAGNSDDLKQKIMWFFSHPEETKAMGKRAKALFEKKYNADIVYADLVKHLEKIVSEGAPKK